MTDSPFPGTPVSLLPIKLSLSTSAYAVVVDNGVGLALTSNFGGGGGSSCSCITEATVITPVYISDYIPIVRSGMVYLATVLDVLHAQSSTPTIPYLNFSIPANSMYLGVI